MKRKVDWTGTGLLLSMVALSYSASAGEAEVLNNESLINMLKNKIPYSVIEKMVEESPREAGRVRLDASPEKLIEISKAAESGGMEESSREKLLHLVRKGAEREKTRLKELVDRFMNVCMNWEEKSEYEAMVRELLREGKAVAPTLLLHIEEESDRKRAGVLDVVGRLGDNREAVVNSVRLMLDDREKTVRAKAAQAVAALAGASLVDELVSTLERQKARYPDGVAMALGYTGDPRAIVPLTRYLKTSSDADGRLATAWALGELRAAERESVDALLGAALDEHDQRLREVAAKALGAMKQTRAVPVIIKGVERFDKGRAELLKALGAFRTQKAIEYLLPRTTDDDPAVRRAAEEALKTVTGENLEGEEQWRTWYSRIKNRLDWFQPDAN